MFNLMKSVKPTVVVALSTSAAKVLDYDNNRGRAIIQNQDAAIVVTLGVTSSVTDASTSGIVLAAGEIYVYYGATPLYAVAASDTPNISITVETTVSSEDKITTIVPVTLSTTAKRVSLRNSSKVRTTVANSDASIIIYVGSSAVTSTYVALAAGKKVTFESIDAIYALAASGTPVLTVLETKR